MDQAHSKGECRAHQMVVNIEKRWVRKTLPIKTLNLLKKRIDGQKKIIFCPSFIYAPYQIILQ
jgi:hypothetical protein